MTKVKNQMGAMKTAIYALIGEIATAENVTKIKLAELSRQILPYVMQSNDIDAVNRLAGVLTPINKRTFIRFATSFLPWQSEKDVNGAHITFGKQTKADNAVETKGKKIIDFLGDEKNTIWTWAAVDPDSLKDKKKKNYHADVVTAVTKALAGNQKTGDVALSVDSVISAILLGGVSFDDMLVAEALTHEGPELEAVAA